MLAIRRFLGLTGYYRKFIKDYADISSPLSNLTRKGIPFVWTEKCQQAFEILRDKLISKPILQYPDFSQQFVLYTDASDFALEAVFSQRNEKKEESVIGYASQKYQPAEQNYYTTEKECLTVVWAVAYYHKFLYAKPFTIVTNHQALKVLDGPNSGKGRVARWNMSLQPYKYKVEYRKGSRHTNANTLSRLYQT